MGVPFSIKDKIAVSMRTSAADFQAYLKQMKKDMREDLESKDDSYHELSLKALMGDPEAVTYFLNEIDKHLRRYPFTGDIPAAYSSKIEALFQEWKGFGPPFAWITNRKYSESSGLQMIGKQIFHSDKGSYQLYPYQMPSDEHVNRLVRTLKRHDESLRLDHSNPAGELKMNDPLWPGRFIRLAIWVPNRVWKGFTTITMRRQVVEYLSIADQAGTRSIPEEAVQMLTHYFLTLRNTIVAGPVGSGKSTFANTVVGEQLDHANECVGLIMIEKHPESIIPYVKQGHRIIPVIANEKELMDVGIESLRHDPKMIYMTEMRYHEWEFFVFCGEKGHKGLIGTYHTTDTEDIPYQGAMAIYTKLGGSLKGHLMSTLKACEFVLVMEEDDVTKQKRLTRFSEIQYDPVNKKVYSNDIMRWNEQKQCWEYNDQLLPTTIENMKKKQPQATEAFLSELKRLANKRRIANPIKESLQSQMALTE